MATFTPNNFPIETNDIPEDAQFLMYRPSNPSGTRTHRRWWTNIRDYITGQISAAGVGNYRSVLSFPGSDAQAKLTNALASGEKHLIIPAGQNITVEAAKSVPANTTLMGAGGAKITGSGADFNLLELTGDDVTIESLELVCVLAPAGNLFTTIKGCGVYGDARARTTLRRLKVSGHQNWGVCLGNAVDSTVESCLFTGGVRVASVDHTKAGADICVFANSHKNKIRGNRCYGGILNGIHLQTFGITGSATQTFNEITGNHVTGCGGHGIMLYAKEPDIDVIYGNIVNDNVVWEISGDIPNHNSDPNPLIYGNGIYVQGYHGSTVVGNSVRRTNLSSQAATSPIPCGGISVTNVTGAVVVGNNVEICAAWGIYVQNSNQYGAADDTTVVEGNRVFGCTEAGIRVANQKGAKIVGNTCGDNTTHGIQVVGGTYAEDVEVLGNTCRGNGSDGIQVFASGAVAASPKIIGNTCQNNGRYGLNFEATATTDAFVTDNILDDNATRNLSVSSGNTFRSLRQPATRGSPSSAQTSISSDYPEGVLVDSAVSGSLSIGLTSPRTIKFTGVLTANRTISFPNMGVTSQVPPDAEYYIYRAAGATGAFSLNIGTGPLVALTAEKQWAQFKRVGSAIELTGYGTLP